MAATDFHLGRQLLHYHLDECILYTKPSWFALKHELFGIHRNFAHVRARALVDVGRPQGIAIVEVGVTENIFLVLDCLFFLICSGFFYVAQLDKDFLFFVVDL